MREVHCAWCVIRKPMSNIRALSLLEIRVLGVLSEKQRTVPDSYPLTLNSLRQSKLRRRWRIVNPLGAQHGDGKTPN